MNKLSYCEKKSLKLTNVLKYKLLIEEEDCNLNLVIEQMQSYIKAKGGIQVGPLIQYTKTTVNEEGELKMEVILMLQCNKYINHVEPPYLMESIVRLQDAMYCRYKGPELFLKYAHEKISIEAFEKDIKLADYNYTIFVDNNPEEDIMIADVFIPRAEKE